MKKKRILSAIFAMLMTASVAISPILGCTPASPPTTEPPTPPTPVDMQGVSLSGAKVYYDGNKHSLSVEGAPVGASITYTYNGENVDGVTEVGVYVVVARISAEGYKDKTLTAMIEIATLLEMKSLVLEGKTVEYNGAKHSLSVAGAPSGASITYTYNGENVDGVTEVGTYVVVAKVTAEGYKDKTLTATLEIKNVELKDFTGVNLEEKTVDYDGNKHSLSVEGVPVGATVTYTYNGANVDGVTEVGTYVVVARITADGYKDKTLTAMLVISPIEKDPELEEITGVTLDGKTLEYDGAKHSLLVVGAPVGATVTYTYNDLTVDGVTEVGTYVVVAKITADGYYEKTLTATLVITEVQLLEMTGITFDGKSVIYDGNKHSLLVEGAPSGASITYTYNGESVESVSAIGSYVVTAVIKLEGYKDKTVSATLEIKDLLTMTGVELASKTVDYDGEEHSLEVEGAPGGAVVTYTYNEKEVSGVTDIGKYIVVAKISAKNYKTKTLTATLTILGALSYVSSSVPKATVPTVNTATSTLANVPLEADAFSAKDLETSHTPVSPVTVTLTASTAFSSGANATVSGSVVTISAGGTFYIKGSASVESKVQIVVNDTAKAENVFIVLQNVNLTNDGKAPLYVKKAKKVFLILEGENTLTSTGTFLETDEDGVDGTVFAKDNLTIKGTGSLTINSVKKGIVAKDNLRITGGTVVVNSKARSVDANDCFSISNANVTLSSENNDGVTVENLEDVTKGYFFINSGSLTINSKKDGIQTSGAVEIVGGTVNITAGGGYTVVSDPALTSAKGIKSTGDILIKGGNVVIDASEDAIHGSSSVEFNGGSLSLRSNKDAVDVDKSITVNGASITSVNCLDGLKGESVTVKSGNINIKSLQDGLKAIEEVGDVTADTTTPTEVTDSHVCFINITGGTVKLDVEDNGLDSKGNIAVSGGSVTVFGSKTGGKALNYNGKATVSGGKLIAFGLKEKAVNFSHASVENYLISLDVPAHAGEKVIVKKDNDVLFDVALAKETTSIVLSSNLSAGEYSICVGVFEGTLIVA
ncbi:MAG: carbohydrate-binding domain-containing protein [Clostridia bacterium]|nr:carbohydrate-binding domain-containing protein [Clostridia bacterium]